MDDETRRHARHRPPKPAACMRGQSRQVDPHRCRRLHTGGLPWKRVDDPRYVPPPAFAPPQLRVAPLNETAVLGRTSYPSGPYAQPPQLPGTGLAARRRLAAAAARPQRAAARAVASSSSACVIVALAAIGIVVSRSRGAAHRAHTLHLPQAFDNYTRVTTLQGSQVQSMFTAGAATFGGIGSDDLTDALVAVYADISDSSPSVLFIGFTAKTARRSARAARRPVRLDRRAGAGRRRRGDRAAVGRRRAAGRRDAMRHRRSRRRRRVGRRVGRHRHPRHRAHRQLRAVGAPATRPSTQRTGTLTRDLRAAAEH